MRQQISKGLHYRQASVADHRALQQTARIAYGSYQDVLLPGHWKEMKATLEDDDLVSRLLQQATAFICEIDGAVAGVVYVMPSGHPAKLFSADWAYIRLLGVLPQYRGLGIATGLMKQCIACAQASGEQVLALHTAPYQSAWRIYERLGFKKIKDLGQLLGKDYWLYTLDLKQGEPTDHADQAPGK